MLGLGEEGRRGRGGFVSPWSRPGTRARGPPGALVGPAWPARSRVKQSISLQRAGEPALTRGSARRAPREPPRGLQQPRGSGRAHRALLASGTCLEAARLSRGASAWGVPVRGPRGGVLVGGPRQTSSWGICAGPPRGASSSGVHVGRPCRASASGVCVGCPVPVGGVRAGHRPE